MKRYFIAPIAEQDIDEIITYIANDNPGAALKMLEGFFKAMDMLADNPQAGYTARFYRQTREVLAY